MKVGQELLFETSLLQHNILPNNQPVGGHLLELGHDAADVIVGINEDQNDGQFATRFDEMCSMDMAPAEESRNGMKSNRAEDILLAQVFQNLQVERTVMPRVALGQIYGDLNGHGSRS